MIRPIITYQVGSSENPRVLLEETRAVTDFSSREVTECIRDLSDTLDDFIARNGNRRGISGLSATQIGVDLAISVVQTTEEKIVLINPVVVEERGRDRLFRIGCFSLFDYRAMVRYNDEILVEYQNESGETVQKDFSGDRSCVIQHEIDHLHGLLLFARLPHGEKDLFIPDSCYESSVRMPVPVQYSSLFNDYTDLTIFLETQKKRYDSLLAEIRSVTPGTGSILELGDGTGAAAVLLQLEGYRVCSCQTDRDTADLARKIAAANGSELLVLQKDLPDDLSGWNTIYSSERFQFMAEAELVHTVSLLLKHCAHLVLMVPSDPGHTDILRGCEFFRTSEQWSVLFAESGAHVLNTTTAADTGETVFVLSPEVSAK